MVPAQLCPVENHQPAPWLSMKAEEKRFQGGEGKVQEEEATQQEKEKETKVSHKKKDKVKGKARQKGKEHAMPKGETPDHKPVDRAYGLLDEEE